MKKLFLDIDDTFKNTESYLRQVLNSRGFIIPKDVPAYSLYGNIDSLDIFKEVFSNYSLIPDIQGFKENFMLINAEYDIILCSTYNSGYEYVAKKKLAKQMGKDIILCDGNSSNWDKSEVDMFDSVFIDDSTYILSKSNAKTRINLYNPYNFYFDAYKESFNKSPIALVSNWFEISDILVGVNVSEEFRERVYKGI